MTGNKLLNAKQFEARLFATESTQAVGLTTVTVPEMRKRGNPWFGGVSKITTVNGFINSKYTRVVNRQRTREDKAANFRAVERAWGIRIKGTPLVSHSNVEGTVLLYLEIQVTHRTWEYRETDTGTLIDEDQLRPFLKPRRPQRRQGLDREIMLRDYRLDHIAEMRIGGEVWRVRKCWQQLQRLQNSLFAEAGI